MSQALFEVPFDAESRLPLLPRSADTGDFTLFDGGPVYGWCQSTGSETPPTVTVRLSCSAATLLALKADASLLWLADVGSPIKVEAVSPSDANKAEAWLKAKGWDKAKDKTATDKVKAARDTQTLAKGVIEGLHVSSLDTLERVQLQDGWPPVWGEKPPAKAVEIDGKKK